MIDKICNKFIKFATKGYTKIPLLRIDFNWKVYSENGEENSCNVIHHPDFSNDEILMDMIREVIDYIRANYDMERFTRM